MANKKPIRKYLLPLNGSKLKEAFPNLRIKVCVFSGGGGTIETNLKNAIAKQDADEQLWNAVFNIRMEAIESLLLALACAGVDLDSPEFMDGILTTMDGLVNKQ